MISHSDGKHTVKPQYAIKGQKRTGELATGHEELERMRQHSQGIELSLQKEQELNAATHETLQQETIARHVSEQQVAGLQECLDENETHRLSLEEKHRHAR